MATKNLTFLINLHHPYIRHIGQDAERFSQENSLLFENISNVYIPLLNMLGRLEQEGIPFKIALVFSPALCSLLTDDEIKMQYIEWLDSLIELCRKEVERTSYDAGLKENAESNLANLEARRHDFTEVYAQDLIKHFAVFAKKDMVEILATAGTYLFMPHYVDMPEVLNAQVETGLYAVKQFFGIAPEGFFLPEMAYVPGIEKILKSYGLNYTLLPSQSFLFSKTAPEAGVFKPARCKNFLTLFAAEKISIDYAANPCYKNVIKDIAWELDHKDLAPFVLEGNPRRATTCCYWNNLTKDEGLNGESLDSECIYDAAKALVQVKADAEDFFVKTKDLLDQAADLASDDVCISYVLDSSDIAGNWAEGILWLEKVISTAGLSDVRIASYSDLLFEKTALQKIEPYPAAFSEASYGEEYLSSRNAWMIRYLRKACERLVDLTGRFPEDTGLKERLLNLGCRELMLAQSCELSKMIEDNNFAEYASGCFKNSIIAFTKVFDALGSNTVSTEWLCNLEKKHALFPWMNYRIFSKKR